DKNNERISINLPDEVTDNDSNIDLYRGNMDDEALTEDDEASFENDGFITLKKGQRFDDFDHAEKHIRNYTEYMGFKIVMRRSTVVQTNEDEKNHLYNRRKSWARGFTTTLFTLGIESTSFVESQNACLKHIIESSNTSLYELGKVLIDSVEDNIRQKHYEEITRGVPFTVNTITIFTKIESLISRYLHPNVVQFLVGQMKESVFYISFRSNIEEIQNMTMNKPSESDNFKNEPDCVFLCAQFLLQQLDCSNIKEVWKVSRVTRQNINHVVFCLTDGSYSCTCLLQQKQGL
ncbi:13747_t:CDS:2, partial [Racocetra persica]